MIPAKKRAPMTGSASGGGGEAWRGKNRYTGPALAWFGVPLSFFFFFFVRYTVPRLWHTSAYFLLYSCCTIIVITLWVRGLFLYHCCMMLPTAVVLLLYGVAGWIGFVGVSMGFIKKLKNVSCEYDRVNG